MDFFSQPTLILVSAFLFWYDGDSLFHPSLGMLATPVRRVPISLVQEDVVFSYTQGIELQINKMFLTYQQLCYAKKVNTRFSLIEHDDVASAIIKQISSYGINKLVTGSTSSNSVTRRFRSHDVPETVLKNAPSFCTVHIVPIRKLSSADLTSSKEFKIRNPEHFSNQSSGFSDMTNLATLKGMTESRSEGFSIEGQMETCYFSTSGNQFSIEGQMETYYFSTSGNQFSIEGIESPRNTGLPGSTPPLSIGNLPNFDMETYTFSTSGNQFNLDTASTDVLCGSLQGEPPIFSHSLGGGHGNVIDEMEISPWNVKTAPASNNEQNMRMEVERLRLELKQKATKANITANERTKEKGRQLAAEREAQQRRYAEIRARIESEVRKKANKAPESKQISVQSRHKKEEMDAMPPKHFLCPILQDVMDDPHMADDGFTYEYAFIRNWLENHNTSPITNQTLQQNILIPNNTLRSAIREWKIKSGFSNEDYDR